MARSEARAVSDELPSGATRGPMELAMVMLLAVGTQTDPDVSVELSVGLAVILLPAWAWFNAPAMIGPGAGAEGARAPT